jgi:hypothetical protein
MPAREEIAHATRVSQTVREMSQKWRMFFWKVAHRAKAETKLEIGGCPVEIDGVSHNPMESLDFGSSPNRTPQNR